MTEPLADTWHSRDLPVLRAVVSLLDESDNGIDDVGAVSDRARLPADVATRSLVALGQAGLDGFHSVSMADGTTFITIIEAASGDARRLVGSWPTPETAADRIIAALEQIAANTDDEDTRTRAEKARDALSGAGRTIAIGVATAAIGGAVT